MSNTTVSISTGMDRAYIMGFEYAIKYAKLAKKQNIDIIDYLQKELDEAKEKINVISI